MKLTLAEPKYLKESINVISELVDEGTFKINSNGIEMVAMDPANVAMVIFKLLSSCFVEYEVNKEIELGINLNSLKQVLRRAKPNDTLTLDVGESNRVAVTLKSNTTRKFSIPTIDLEEKDQKVPELAFPVIVETPASVISEGIEDIGVVSDAVTFICEPEKLTLKGEGDLSKAETSIDKESEAKITNNEENPVKSKYSLEYLKKVIGGSKIAENMAIMFDADYPLKLDFKEVDKVQLSFILAPRVEND